MEQYLRGYVDYQQDNWTDYLPLAEFATNNHVSESSNMSPFQANYGLNPRMNFGLLRHGVTTNEDQANTLARDMSQVFDFLGAEMFRGQRIQEESANTHRVPAPRYVTGDKVWLSTRNLLTKRPSKKLDWKQIGPYAISRVVSPYAYELNLPASMKVHPVFHVSLLSPAAEDPVPGQSQPPPPPVEIEGEQEWEVDAVLDSHRRHGKLEYLVRYTGYDEPSWQPPEDLEHSPKLVKDFHDRYP